MDAAGAASAGTMRRGEHTIAVTIRIDDSISIVSVASSCDNNIEEDEIHRASQC